MASRPGGWMRLGAVGEPWMRRQRRSVFTSLRRTRPSTSAPVPRAALLPEGVDTLGPQLDRLLERHLGTTSSETLQTLKASFHSLLGLSPAVRGPAAESDLDWLELRLTALNGELEAAERCLGEVQERILGRGGRPADGGPAGTGDEPRPSLENVTAGRAAPPGSAGPAVTGAGAEVVGRAGAAATGAAAAAAGSARATASAGVGHRPAAPPAPEPPPRERTPVLRADLLAQLVDENVALRRSDRASMGS